MNYVRRGELKKLRNEQKNVFLDISLFFIIIRLLSDIHHFHRILGVIWDIQISLFRLRNLKHVLIIKKKFQ